MLTNEFLKEKWDKLTSHLNGYIRIDSEHPLDWHIGYEGINQKSLLLVTRFEPEIIHSSKSILVAVRQRNDSNWTLSFRLIRDEQEDVFTRLCCDLIDSSRGQGNTKAGLKFVLDRYYQWSKLMAGQRTGLLSESEIKGLLGELLYLKNLMLPGIPLLDIISSWIGPEGADQDFWFQNLWYEIKTLGLGSKTISISSLEQLDVKPSGELILIYIDKTAPNQINSFTLHGIIQQIRESLKTDYTALKLFNDKLITYGYIDLPEYKQQWYRFSRLNRYTVDESFPRLIKENVPSQLVSVNYQLSIQAIEGWKVE